MTQEQLKLKVCACQSPQLVSYTGISQVCVNFYTLGCLNLSNQLYFYPLELMLIIKEPQPIKISHFNKISPFKSNKLVAQSLKGLLIEYQALRGCYGVYKKLTNRHKTETLEIMKYKSQLLIVLMDCQV